MNDQFFDALNALSQENNIDREVLIEKIKDGITKAIKKENPECEHIRVDIEPDTGKLEMVILKEVMPVMFVDDPANEIYIGEARTYDPDIKEGDWVEIPVNPAKIGRVAAQNAKQSIKHDIKDFERNKLIEQYKDKEHEIVSATVQKVEPATLNAVITIDRNEHYFYRSEQIPGEVLKEGDIIKVYIVSIGGTERKQPVVKLSRTHKDLVKRLFELEVPEIADGTVEIKSISRIEGIRSKIAVYSKDKNVDAVGACIGPRKSRISAVVSELKGEKIDVINWCEDEAEFIAKALAPADVIKVELLEPEYKTEDKGEEKEIKKVIRKCRVVVPNNQFSLAIGNKGQNAKLAAGLTGYKIDIVPENPAPEPAEKEEAAGDEAAADAE
ncbi:MAG: transcription termination/antitermination protein NusA [Ruminococcus sp.]|nr:transcription termination/antitermination protein NusA [Ruminococcus sp.]